MIKVRFKLMDTQNEAIGKKITYKIWSQKDTEAPVLIADETKIVPLSMTAQALKRYLLANSKSLVDKTLEVPSDLSNYIGRSFDFQYPELEEQP